MHFETEKEAIKYFEKFIPFDEKSEIFKTLHDEYSPWNTKVNLTPGDIFLFEKVLFKEKKITYPQVGIFIKTDIYDMALVYKYVDYPRDRDFNITIGQYKNRLYEYKSEEIKEVICWDDGILLYEKWNSLPNWKILKKAYEKTYYYYRPTFEKRNLLIENIIKKGE